MSNPFEQHAEAVRPNRFSKEAAAERAAQQKGEREAAPLAKKRAEKAVLMRGWRKARREEWRRTVAGDFGPDLVTFRKAMRRFDETQAQEFVVFVLSQDWLQSMPRQAKAVARGLVTQAVIRLRSKAGFEFIDDALPGEPPTALEICHAFIGGR